MNDRDIRAMLRGATAADVVVGWYFYGVEGYRRYVVNAPQAVVDYSTRETIAYCEMLSELGVEPRYRKQ